MFQLSHLEYLMEKRLQIRFQTSNFCGALLNRGGELLESGNIAIV